MNLRIGEGWDIHRLVEGRPLILGGVQIPYEKGLLGHSDADALLHAITDAILGGAGLGDIGTHFPDTDARFKGADSGVLLQEAVRRVHEAGFAIANVDSTVIAQAPKLAPQLHVIRGVGKNNINTLLGKTIHSGNTITKTNGVKLKSCLHQLIFYPV